jgi:hypothetical protein
LENGVATAASATMALVPIVLFFAVLGVKHALELARKPVGL